MLHRTIENGTALTPDLVVERVGVSAGKTRIVQDLSFHAKAGEVLAIIGPSGSGKTTLMKAMTGELPYSGGITLAGLEVGGLSPEVLAAMRGVLPQASQISFPLNVAEVVGLGLTSSRRERAFRARRIAEALAKVGLSGFEGRSYQELSGGEQQRVQLARVLCQVWDPLPQEGLPHWLFLDEPVSSLDIKHQVQIMQLAADYAKRGGGVVAVMHDLNLTAAFADRVLVMQGGRRLAFGARDEVMQAELLSKAYDFPLEILTRPGGGRPVIVPMDNG
ncbi:Hemin import ATP-binding protein HmuV [Labrenzia sp. THAF191b]|uniref:heme ABC transporter ATP-binding protein n=1 Tax=unclassified Labrenzia TaxID=2648686 RepID=UPI001267B9A5|nr:MULTISPECIES: heme ABC transporter ATP-binding protein [unclassified Labrenzia]QFS98202.1 Hemin import ATP-binding protein HmuV [Labrenzia sp. THAF191b]QFT04516.1 Hemin import ATP-binding protein HmuV [Labrenzia sp. THAF191a]QFT16060.1 Hemin import ATP-binding protein HmuV [Labrenzia sp. THAF187b]